MQPSWPHQPPRESGGAGKRLPGNVLQEMFYRSSCLGYLGITSAVPISEAHRSPFLLNLWGLAVGKGHDGKGRSEV